MYNFKKIYRRKSNYFLILIFSSLLLSLIFLFKYLLVVNYNIEREIYDKHINKEIIVYDNKDIVSKKLKDIKDVVFIYSDYQMLELNNDTLGNYALNPYMLSEMPSLLKGAYPKNSKEILIPNYTYINGKKEYLDKYINKNLAFKLNNSTLITFKVVGVYDASKKGLSIYYNLDYIDNLLNNTEDYNYTGYTRVLVNHYKNINKVLDIFGNNASIYDSSGLEEINVYNSLFDLILILIIIIIIFIIIMAIIVIGILYYNTRNDRFIEYVLGFRKKQIILNYIYYLLKILFISLSISIVLYFLGIGIFNIFITTNNLILNSLFSLNNKYNIYLILLFILFSIIMRKLK